MDDDDEPAEGTVLAALHWLNDQVTAILDRLAALERIIGVPVTDAEV